MNTAYHIFTDQSNFLITNSNIQLNNNYKKITLNHQPGFHFLFGYCFTTTKLLKNQLLSGDEYQDLRKHHESQSGLFAAVQAQDGKIEIIIDPLTQYNIFYYIKNNEVSISNSISLLQGAHEITETNSDHLYDSIAYQSPLRGLTILKDVYALQSDDLNKTIQQTIAYKPSPPIDTDIIKIKSPNLDIHSSSSYEELLNLYLDRLNKRAEILSKQYDEIHAQLTGGADSRLVLSSFLSKANAKYYCYGDGKSQNRLCFEAIVNTWELSKCEEVYFCGTNLNTIPLIAKALIDSNFRKPNNLNTYMNGPFFNNKNICKVTGYYGANISGSVVLPPKDTQKNSRTKSVSSTSFTYHKYVGLMKERHQHLREAAFSDIFYINNRGQSHYAAHSIADNKYIDSFDILYDLANLELVKKCPYEEIEIDKNAISIDLIYLNNKSLATFPYESRKIPKYRDFGSLPTINCFTGLNFTEQALHDFHYKRPTANTNDFNALATAPLHLSLPKILENEMFLDFFKKHPELNYLKNEKTTTSNIALFYAVGEYIINNNLLPKVN